MKSRLPKIFVSLVHCIEAWVPRGVQQLRMACGHEIFMNERGDPTASPPKSLKYLSTPTSITINDLFQVVIKVFPSFDSIIKLANIYNLMSQKPLNCFNRIQKMSSNFVCSYIVFIYILSLTQHICNTRKHLQQEKLNADRKKRKS